ncbi:tRNA methyltransferase complex GCD14 subunit (macronuclear) [Tetrahymena thermophila SB210]|uniref:tRNA (adenine(58)-N(1))-methyltransferase n=1 Tax=Tetrahymena thermophila (strain SB210) TaxID=312017 RepID=Q23UC8_TETTS|nr:tRNA methyltransferase complex GCD14 subunit [Tetrahymena thermophila SB210]EAS00137.3 tRNA methyltransferase complex GCD14 subunit [Tetrahymena thermophila SB210]|eukprot:XP_001020382.3 tRNA methyltransferase complex GCD14 subunit [Tetrahymena thermophila SB210]
MEGEIQAQNAETEQQVKNQNEQSQQSANQVANEEVKQSDNQQQLLSNTIKYGDQVVFYESVNSMKMQTIVENGFFQNRFGYFGHSEVVGKQFGQKIFNLKKNAFIYLLRPDPVLITDTLSHLTQILYQADISYVISKMNIQPGSIVVESGTGSASLSSSIARTIQDEGHLYTFEFNEARAKNGAEVLAAQGLKNFDVIWRDVLSNGFMPIPGERVYNLKEHSADAVFLDLPRPYEAITHAKQVLKKGGRLCCFSPCIEQVMKNCEEMRIQKFVQIVTIEVIQRPFERRERTFQSAFQVLNPNFINNKRKRDEVGDNAQEQENIQEDQQQQIAAEDENENNDEENNQDDEQGEDEEESQEEADQANKKGKQNKNNKKDKRNKQQNNQNGSKPIPQFIRPQITKVVYSSGPKEIKGHTGYLSFGICI